MLKILKVSSYAEPIWMKPPPVGDFPNKSRCIIDVFVPRSACSATRERDLFVARIYSSVLLFRPPTGALHAALCTPQKTPTRPHGLFAVSMVAALPLANISRFTK